MSSTSGRVSGITSCTDTMAVYRARVPKVGVARAPTLVTMPVRCEESMSASTDAPDTVAATTAARPVYAVRAHDVIRSPRCAPGALRAGVRRARSRQTGARAAGFERYRYPDQAIAECRNAGRPAPGGRAPSLPGLPFRTPRFVTAAPADRRHLGWTAVARAVSSPSDAGSQAQPRGRLLSSLDDADLLVLPSQIEAF